MIIKYKIVAAPKRRITMFVQYEQARLQFFRLCKWCLLPYYSKHTKLSFQIILRSPSPPPPIVWGNFYQFSLVIKPNLLEASSVSLL